MRPEPDAVPVRAGEHAGNQQRSVALAPVGGVDDQFGGDVAALFPVVGRVHVREGDQWAVGKQPTARGHGKSRAGGVLPCLTWSSTSSESGATPSAPAAAEAAQGLCDMRGSGRTAVTPTPASAGPAGASTFRADGRSRPRLPVGGYRSTAMAVSDASRSAPSLSSGSALHRHEPVADVAHGADQRLVLGA